MNRQELKIIMQRIDAGIIEQQTICLIGSSASMMMGQQDRATEDIDVWSSASKYREAVLRRAVEDAGLLFDPRDEDIDLPYVQVVHPGIVQVPGFDPETGLWFGDKQSELLWAGERLRLTAPPAEAIIASKMLRFEDRDITDSIWLMAARDVDAKAVIRAIRQLPPEKREDAEANFDVLKYIK
jgi:hypothetical protein